MVEFIVWILFGALAGWIASLIMKTDAEQGAVANILVGIVGAFLGGFLTKIILGRTLEGYNLWSLLVAVLGACLTIALWRAVTNSRS